MAHFSDSWKKAKEDFKRATNVKRPSEPGSKLINAFTRETISSALKTVDAVIAKGDPQSAASSERTPEWLATLGRAQANYKKVQTAYLTQLDQALRAVPAGPEHQAYTNGLLRLKKELKALEKEMQAFLTQATLELKRFSDQSAHAALEKRKWVALFTSDLGRLSASIAAVKANPTEASYNLLLANLEVLNKHLNHRDVPPGFGGPRSAASIADTVLAGNIAPRVEPVPARLIQEAERVKRQLALVKDWLRAAAG